MATGQEKQCQIMFKLLHNCTHLTPSKVMLKIPQVRLQQFMNQELSDVQAGFRKHRGTRDQIANTHCIIEKTKEVQKVIYFGFIDMPKPLIVWITTKCGRFSETWEYQTTLPAS